MTTSKWDKRRACKMLGIPVRVVDMDNSVGGYSHLRDRYIHINPKYDNDRVWVHEIAHTLLHFQYVEGARGNDLRLNAIAELEADTVAYIVCRKLGCEDRQEYEKYMQMFMSRLPLENLSEKILDERMPKLLNIVKLILQAGGFNG